MTVTSQNTSIFHILGKADLCFFVYEILDFSR